MRAPFATDCRHDPQADAGATAAGAAHEQQRASGSYLGGGESRDLEFQQEVRVEGATRLRQVHVEQASVGRKARCHHYVVDRGRQVTEEPLERSRIHGVEGCGAQRAELHRGTLEALGIPAGEDQPGPLSTCPSGCFQSDAGAAADHNNGLPEEFWFALDRGGSGCGAHVPSGQQSRITLALREAQQLFWPPLLPPLIPQSSVFLNVAPSGSNCTFGLSVLTV